MISLEGRCALVTGGSRGIGRAAALLLAGAGADVAITYLSRAADAESVAAGIRALGRRAVVIGGDLADAAVCDRMADAVRGAFGRLDLFVANAGIWPSDDGAARRAFRSSGWRATLSANLDAIFLSTRAALGLMGPGGRVVLGLEHRGAAGRGLSRGLRRHEGRGHRAHQVAGHRVCPGHPRQLRGAGMGGYGDVRHGVCG